MAKKIVKDRILNNLEQAMREIDITGKELSLIAGISQSEISEIKNGRVSPTHDTMLILCSALKCKLEDVFENDYRNVTIIQEME